MIGTECSPILFPLAGPLNAAARLGTGPSLHGCRLMVTPTSWTITGVSRDSTGAPLAGCTCTLFVVCDQGGVKLFLQEQQVVLNADGLFVFTGSQPLPYTYRVTFDLAGAPMRAGITLPTLEGHAHGD